jgi:hypothetical protein
VRESEATAYGSLPVLARKALEPRLERVQQAVRLRERLLDPALTAEETAAGPQERAASSFATALGRAAPERQAGAQRHVALLPGEPVEPFAQPANQQAARDEGRDGARLREVQIELRALRTEIYQLSRALGFTSRDSNRTEFRGVLQERNEQDSGVRLLRWRHKDAQRQARIDAERRRSEVERIAERQRNLLRALQRAEQRLAETPKDLNPGLRDSIIGEIYRARFSIAMFGGANGMGQLDGLEMDVVA